MSTIAETASVQAQTCLPTAAFSAQKDVALAALRAAHPGAEPGHVHDAFRTALAEALDAHGLGSCHRGH